MDQKQLRNDNDIKQNDMKWPENCLEQCIL